MSTEGLSQKRIDIIGEQLQAKIRSKVQVSTFLAGFASTLLSIETARLWQPDYIPRFLYLAIPLMLDAAILYIYAVLKLDALTMPKPFWGRNVHELSPRLFDRSSYWSDEDLRLLQREMVFYWTWLTVVATVLVGLSLIVTLLPFTIGNSRDLLLWTSVSSAISTVLAFEYCRRLGKYAKNRWENLRLQSLP